MFIPPFLTIFSMTVTARLSVTSRSAGIADVHTHLKWNDVIPRGQNIGGMEYWDAGNRPFAYLELVKIHCIVGMSPSNTKHFATTLPYFPSDINKFCMIVQKHGGRRNTHQDFRMHQNVI